MAKKDEAYILGKYTDDAEFKIFTGNLNFEKSKYYVYNSISNGLMCHQWKRKVILPLVMLSLWCKMEAKSQYDAIEGGNATFQTNWRIASNQWHFFHYSDGITQYDAVATAKQIDHFTWGVCGDWGVSE